MKHIKPYRIFENNQVEPQHPGFPKTEDEIHDICKEHIINNYTINEDLSIDVESNVDLHGLVKDFLPLNFNYVSGFFNCASNRLTTLEGSPKETGNYFDCGNNKLISLKGAPKKVGGSFNCAKNELTSLKDGPEEVGNSFYCAHNQLTTLEGSPEKVDNFACSNNKLITLKGSPVIIGSDFIGSNNELTSLKYCPKEVTGSFYFFDNPIYTVVNTFINTIIEDEDSIKEFVQELVQEFNDYDIVRGNTVVLNRLKTFISDFNLEMPNLDEVRKYYKIV